MAMITLPAVLVIGMGLRALGPQTDGASPFALTFGTGHAGVSLSTTETDVFVHKIAPGHTGMLTHFWSTCSPDAESGMVVRYYVDGEKEPSVAFSPPLAAGVGFDDAKRAPWGTKWFGLGAGRGQNGPPDAGQAWFHNFKVPFGTSIRVTVQGASNQGGFYIIIRGGLDLPLEFGGVKLPSEARLTLQQFNGPLQPLQTLDVAHVPRGESGLVFATALAVSNDGKAEGGLNFLEGCYHLYDPVDAPFPGVLLATGTEDFFDSGWYFNAGNFEMPVSGNTHLVAGDNRTEWSGYRVHEMDPLRFRDGVRLTWRCGDMVSKTPGVGKCYTESGGDIAGNPTCNRVVSYAWVYTWPSNVTRQ